VDGKQSLIVFVDRTVLEGFASDSLTCLTLPFLPKQDDPSVTVEVKGGHTKMDSLHVYKPKSVWETRLC